MPALAGGGQLCHGAGRWGEFVGGPGRPEMPPSVSSVLIFGQCTYSLKLLCVNLLVPLEKEEKHKTARVSAASYLCVPRVWDVSHAGCPLAWL